MATAKTAIKKIEGLRKWMLDDKEIKPVLYVGRAVGHGRYFACMVDGVMVLDNDGVPVPFRQLGQLV
ncbi:MAG: hypothetical protein E4H14_05055 [Candidatus Thorarchaeota archaeon]|nr:MAG: hypothetical protein E4H14_05055 [Candidatus Thorarchaeota archaeon]